MTSAGVADHGELLRIDLRALGGPPPDVSEAPYPILLGVSAIALGSLAIVLRRRRTGHA